MTKPRRLAPTVDATTPPPGVTPLDVPGTAPGLPEAFVVVGARFWPRVDAGDVTQDLCWTYRGGHGGQGGSSPTFNVHGHHVSAARVAWELSGRGPLFRVALRNDVQRCGNPRCIRPSHQNAQAELGIGRRNRGLADLLADDPPRKLARVPAPRTAPPDEPPGFAAAPALGGVSHAASGAPLALYVSPMTATALSALSAPGSRDVWPPDDVAALVALVVTPDVCLWHTRTGTLHVWTPWGRFEHEHPRAAIWLATRARPEACAA